MDSITGLLLRSRRFGSLLSVGTKAGREFDGWVVSLDEDTAQLRNSVQTVSIQKSSIEWVVESNDCLID